MKRLLALLLAVCLAAALVACTVTPSDPVPSEAAESNAVESDASESSAAEPVCELPETTLPGRGLPYADMVLLYDPADTETALRYGHDAVMRGDADAVADTLRELENLARLLVADYQITNFELSRKTSDTALTEKTADFEEALTEFDRQLTLLLEDVLDAGLDEAVAERYGKEDFDILVAGMSATDEELVSIAGKVSRLNAEYSAIRTVFFSGVTGINEEILAAGTSLTQDDYNDCLRRYDTLCEDFFTRAGEIFKESVELNIRVASLNGYDDYTHYSYDKEYGRDYTPEEAQVLHAAVKQLFVPLLKDLRKTPSGKAYAAESSSYHALSFTASDLLSLLTGYADRFGDRLSESVRYMIDHGLYCLDNDPDMVQGAFTASLRAYDAAILFDYLEGTANDFSTLVHESGHYCFMFNDTADLLTSSHPLDLQEIDSQALELLFTHYYGEIFPGCADYALRQRITAIVSAVADACLQDEFQQYVYAHPDETVDGYGKKYRALCKEYGFDDREADDWMLISHTFEMPFYYISYGTSALPALELWALSLADFDEAAARYERLGERGPRASYRDSLAMIGLADPFDTETLKTLADTVRAAVLK